MTILKHKVVVCTLHKFLVLNDGENIKKARLSKLQELLLYRMLDKPHAEAWTGLPARMRRKAIRCKSSNQFFNLYCMSSKMSST